MNRFLPLPTGVACWVTASASRSARLVWQGAKSRNARTALLTLRVVILLSEAAVLVPLMASAAEPPSTVGAGQKPCELERNFKVTMIKFTVYPDAGHDAWTDTYANPELYEWLLQQKRAAK